MYEMMLRLVSSHLKAIIAQCFIRVQNFRYLGVVYNLQ